MSIDNIEQLAVSTADLNARYQRWIRIDPDASRDISTLPGMDLETKAKSTTAFPRPKLQTPYVEPRDRLEQSIAETWQKILGIEEIGIHDDFFELGGHSLLATQLVTRMRDTYQVQLPLRRLFESPTVSGIADMIREVGYKESSALQPDVDLSEAVSEQYESLITPVSRDGDLELSYGQQRLWFLDQIEPDSPLYNNFSAISFSGRINIEGIRYSLQKIISRHEILRTTFQEKAGKPVQIIHETMDLPLNYADLSDISGGTRQERVLQLAFEEARRPFDLKTGPLMRFTLLRLTDEEHVVFLTMHHIISDGWSVRVLIEEVGAYYSAFVTLDSENLHQFSLPALKIQYVDYAYWQREWLKQDVQSKQIDYWANHLADRGEGNGNVELFPDRPRPPFQTSNGASIWFEVPPDITRKLTELSQSSGVTLFMTLMAALQALLLRYTGQEDISIGTPIANRNSVEVESLIGFILNTLIIRTDLTGDPTFSELLQRVKTVALEAYAHQDIPFEMLVEALQPERDMSRAPFFQIIFDLQEAPLPSLNLPGLVISPLQVDNGTAKFDLAVSMEMGRGQDKDRLGGFFNYNTDLFNRDTIDRLIKNWLVLLGNVVLDPDEKISKLNILTDAEKRKLILDWNSNLSQFEKSNLIQEQIESQMLHDPKKIALSLIETASSVVGELTYQELDLRANQLANHLLGIGVSRDEIIGVSLRRSTEMVVVLLAVLKAGAAFLPLDPSYPEGRILYMIDDASVKVIITQEEILSSFPVERSDGSKLNLICVDQDDSEIRQAVDSKPDVLIYGDNLAYVIYTSGSTGLPKGVMISHNEFADHCSVILNHFELTSQDRELQFASFNFDQGLEQIFTSLAAGASLFLRGNEIWPGSEFDKIVRDHSLTVVNIPPAYWHQWTQYVSSVNKSEENNHDANYEQLRLVISGGDVMSPETLRLWSDSPMNQARLLNAYGPTETTITATTYDVSVPEKTSSIREEALVPIGRPLPNRTSYILDMYGNPVPIGVPGELYFGGMGLSRGYLKRSELTAEKFVPDPFYPLLSADLIDSDFVGKRLYRTGDLVRYLPDGNIEFLGRFDNQVKLRGFRIELGEIETVLGFHPAVSEAVVVVRQNNREIEGQNASKVDKRLIAYIVLREEQDVSEKELYDYLTNNLPNYMVPSGIMMLNEFPLTPSGKLDRKALPEPDEISSLVDREYIAPRDPIEQELAILWTEILGIEWDGDQSPISILDNFFELGGHSLLATQIISRLRETYHIELPVRRLFEQPTIAGLAYIISESLAEVQTPDDLDELLAELDGLSDEEVRTLLEDDSTKAAGEQS